MIGGACKNLTAHPEEEMIEMHRAIGLRVTDVFRGDCFAAPDRQGQDVVVAEKDGRQRPR